MLVFKGFFGAKSLRLITLFITMLSICAAGHSQIVIDHTCTTLANVPTQYIESAKATLKILHGHKEYGGQVTAGMKEINVAPTTYSTTGANGSLSYQEYYNDIGTGGDLTFATAIRNKLNSPFNDRNVVMWAWNGGVSGNTEAGINAYLNEMAKLETEYPNVKFIYMTGHLDGSLSTGNLHTLNNIIRDFCVINKKILFDFGDLDRFDPDGIDYLDLYGDNACNFVANGQTRNWAIEWCADNPGKCTSCNCTNSQSLNCDLKARAFWWMMARIAGWTGDQPTPTPTPTPSATPTATPTPTPTQPPVYATIYVPSDFSTIQGAIDASSNGTEIIVSEGTYSENLVIGGKDVKIHSGSTTDTSIIQNTVIDGNQNGPVISFSGVESPFCTIEGFTIQNGRNAYGGGISGNGTQATIANNIIKDNVADVTKKKKKRREGFTYGGGLFNCDGLIKNNLITGNSSVGFGGGLSDCDGEISGNTITGNTSVSKGGGIFQCSARIDSNKILGNSADIGAGISDSNGSIYNNLIAWNNASSSGGGIYYSAGPIKNNTVYGNSAGASGGGVAECYGDIANTIIWGNSAPIDAQIVNSENVAYCWIEGVAKTAPGFVDETLGDLHLDTVSKCIDAGEFVSDLAKDFEGDKRGLKGCEEARGDGSNYDIGYDEYVGIPPTITLLTPDKSAELVKKSYIIKWEDADPDSNAKISLYYDADNKGADGTLIVDNILENNDEDDSYVWNINNLPAGTFWVYAIINDSSSEPVISYSPGSIKTIYRQDEIVEMLNGEKPVPQELNAQIDINGDGVFDISDLVARIILKY